MEVETWRQKRLLRGGRRGGDVEAEEALYVEEEAVDVQVEDASGVEVEKDRDLWFQNDCEHSAVKIITISLYDYSSLLLA